MKLANLIVLAHVYDHDALVIHGIVPPQLKELADLKLVTLLPTDDSATIVKANITACDFYFQALERVEVPGMSGTHHPNHPPPTLPEGCSILIWCDGAEAVRVDPTVLDWTANEIPFHWEII